MQVERPDRPLVLSCREGCEAKSSKLTNLFLGLLVTLARLNSVLGRLGLGDGLLDSDEPSVALSSGRGLEGVLVAGELESESKGTVLGKVGRVGLFASVSQSFVGACV